MGGSDGACFGVVTTAVAFATSFLKVVQLVLFSDATASHSLPLTIGYSVMSGNGVCSLE